MKNVILVLMLLVSFQAKADDKKGYQKCWCNFNNAASNRDCKKAYVTKCFKSNEAEVFQIKDNPAKYLCSIDAKTICIDPMAQTSGW